MLGSMLFAVTMLMYGVAAYLLWRSPQRAVVSGGVLGLCLAAVLLHGGEWWLSWHRPQPVISLSLAVSLAGLVSALCYVLLARLANIGYLGLLILPFAMLALGGGAVLSTTPYGLIADGTGWHLLLAVPTWGLTCVAFAQACLLLWHRRQLHHPAAHRHLATWPALETMQTQLFWLTLLGFSGLTLSLINGLMSSLQYYGQWLVITHHTIFAFLAWLVFAGLLAGRLCIGWRAAQAAQWTIVAFITLSLAYFGTRVVNDLILLR